MTPQKKVTDYAQSWVGKLNETNGDNNVSIMHEDIDEVVCGFSMTGQPWCQFFIVYCMAKCFGNETGSEMMYQKCGSVSCGCAVTADCFRSAGAFYSEPEIGDQMFLYSGGGINHVGMVVEIEGNTIYTVEGNYSNGCNLVKHYRNESAIAGYGRAKWSLAGEQDSSIVAEPKTTTTTQSAVIIPTGTTGPGIAALQGLLIYVGQDPGRFKDRRGVESGIDGDAGNQASKTISAMKLAISSGKITEEQVRDLLAIFG